MHQLWPAEPVNLMRTVSSGKPAAPHLRVISLPVMVPVTRLTLRMGSSACLFTTLDGGLADVEQFGHVQ
jgi:hypothetical protein